MRKQIKSGTGLFPSRKYTIWAAFQAAIVYVISVALFDVLNQPAWLWIPVTASFSYFIRYNAEKRWVFR